MRSLDLSKKTDGKKRKTDLWGITKLRKKNYILTDHRQQTLGGEHPLEEKETNELKIHIHEGFSSRGTGGKENKSAGYVADDSGVEDGNVREKGGGGGKAGFPPRGSLSWVRNLLNEIDTKKTTLVSPELKKKK